MGERFNLKMQKKYKSVADLNNNTISWHKKKKALLKDFRELRIKQDKFIDTYFPLSLYNYLHNLQQTKALQKQVFF